MRSSKLARKLLRVENTVLTAVTSELDGSGTEVLVLHVRPDRRLARRCPECGRPCPRYDKGKRRRWRHLDACAMPVAVEADAPRIRCPEHGVKVAAVPWARHDSGFTRAFEDTVTWLCASMADSNVAEYMRIEWRTVQAIVTRVVAELDGKTDRLTGVRRAGIDELAYRKGQRYIMIAVDHDTGRLIWASEGRNQDTVRKFFDALGEDRSKQLTAVTADGAAWIHDVIRDRAPQAKICLDAFHAVVWATEALEKLRRRISAALKADGQAGLEPGARWALLKDQQKLSPGQRATLASLQKVNGPLFRGYLMKEQLRDVFKAKKDGGAALLAGLLSWCSRSRIPEFVKLGQTLRTYRQLILNALELGLSNARVEATNTHLRALTKRANGYHSPDALIARANLTRGGLCPPLPGR
ncbi:MAG TPA: ISL3 family transposase [Streptosporangiaceae bacterium]